MYFGNHSKIAANYGIVLQFEKERQLDSYTFYLPQLTETVPQVTLSDTPANVEKPRNSAVSGPLAHIGVVSKITS